MNPFRPERETNALLLNRQNKLWEDVNLKLRVLMELGAANKRELLKGTEELQRLRQEMRSLVQNAKLLTNLDTSKSFNSTSKRALSRSQSPTDRGSRKRPEGSKRRHPRRPATTQANVTSLAMRLRSHKVRSDI